MSLFKALNARILAALDQQAGHSVVVDVALADGQLLLADGQGVRHSAAWRDLSAVLALRRECYAGDEVVLLLEFDGRRFCELPASCRGWVELCEAIAALPGALPFGQWHARVLAADLGSAIKVWSAS